MTPSDGTSRPEGAAWAQPSAPDEVAATAGDDRALAAVDLGSNSFHMVVARLVGGRLRIVDKLRERVQLAAGLNDDGSFDDETRERALACLERFGQRIADTPQDSVRAVGTYALRRAWRAAGFRDEAATALGHPIEVIHGQEEARLVYLGVAHDVTPAPTGRLVVDIGGGSTECILGRGFDVGLAQSLHMGCVSFTRPYFKKGRLDRERFDKARLAARLQLRSLEMRYREQGWTECLGSSGTINEIAAVLLENGWTKGGITRKGLKRLRDALLDHERLDRVSIPGLTEDRRPVLPGGLAVLLAVFEGLRIDRMDPSGAALREGILHDLIGRIRHHDVRADTIEDMASRYQVDRVQAERVERTAVALLAGVVTQWLLYPERSRKLLAWAARIHEIGLSVARGGYHKHGAYLVEHSNMPGFSRDDQNLLAFLVRAQRRRPPVKALEGLDGTRRTEAITLGVLFRLAVRMNRSRAERQIPLRDMEAGERHLRLAFDDGWLDEHPLTKADLAAEAELLAEMGFALEYA